MSTSHKEILDLLANGKISATEAADLLSGVGKEVEIDSDDSSPEDTIKVLKKETAVNSKKASWLHVRVRDLESGRSKVTVNVPIGIVKFGLKIGGRFSPELNDLDWNDLESMMYETESGVLVDVQDEEGGEHVQVFID
ncbi:MAG: DUF2089 domain-containing protein [Chloroflexi bacterium]|nr:DUF2089 domain-containing protein [Chloroflexota bacterium]